MKAFEIITETEKAIKVKYPYYEKTSEYKKAHIQKYIELWLNIGCVIGCLYFLLR